MYYETENKLKSESIMVWEKGKDKREISGGD